MSLLLPHGDGARAATITRIYDFYFQNFFPGGISPVDPWEGTVKVEFDPAVDSTASATSYFSSNLPASYGSFQFYYVAASKVMVIGDSCTGFTCSAFGGSDTAYFDVTLTDPDNPSVGFGHVSSTISFQLIDQSIVRQVSLHEGPDPSLGVPEPATLVLLVMGLAGLGLARRRPERRRANQ